MNNTASPGFYCTYQMALWIHWNTSSHFKYQKIKQTREKYLLFQIKNRSQDQERGCLVGFSGPPAPGPPWTPSLTPLSSSQWWTFSFDSFSGWRLNVKFSAKMGSMSCQLFPLVKCTFIFNLLRSATYDRRSWEKRGLRGSLLPYLNWLCPDK